MKISNVYTYVLMLWEEVRREEVGRNEMVV